MADTPQERVSLVDPAGQLVTVPQSQANDALDGGYSVPDATQAHEIVMRQRYGQGTGNLLQSGAEGAARGLSFGLSDLALAQLDQEGVRERKERNPVAAGVGEAGGVALGLLGTGGLVEGVGAGVRGVAALGELGAAGAERALAGVAERSWVAHAAAKGIAKGFGGALEGAVYGGGQAISEDALGQSNDLGQALVAHMGLGALVGGVAGGALGAFGSVADTGTRSIARTLGIAKGATEATEAAATDLGSAEAESGAVGGGTAPEEAIPTPEQTVNEAAAVSEAPDSIFTRAAKGAAKVGHVISGADESVLADALRLDQVGVEFRKAATSELDSNTATRKLADDITASDNAGREITENIYGKAKFEKIKQTIAQDKLPEQIATARNLFNKARQLATDVKAEKTLYRTQGKELMGLADELEARVNKAIASGEDVGAKTFEALDIMKQRMGPMAKPGNFINTPEVKFAGRVRDLYSNEFRSELEAENVWGKAGEIQRRQNKVTTDFLDNIDNFNSHFIEAKPFGKSGFNPKWQADKGKIKSFLSRLGEAENDSAEYHLMRHLETQKELVKEVRSLYDLSPDAAAKIDAVEARNTALADTVKKMKHDIGIKNKVADISKTKTGRTAMEAMKFFASVEKGIADKFGRGPAAGAKMAAENPEAYQAAVRMAERQGQASKLAALQRTVQKVNKAIADNVGEYVDKLGKTSRRAVTPAAVGAIHNIALKPGEQKATKDRRVSYRRCLGELNELTTNPAHLVDVLSKNLQGLTDAAPKTSAQMQLTLARAVGFLQEKAPKDPIAALHINPQNSRWQPSDTDLMKFERYLHAAENPLSILTDLKQGVVTKEAVETVRTLYPSLMDKITRTMLPDLVEKKDIPYQQRLQLSQLFGVPVDGTSRPQFWKNMQAVHDSSATTAGPQNPSRSSKNTRAESTMTPLQRSMNT